MKTIMKTVSLGLYIVAISASLSMAADKTDDKSVSCPSAESREERDLIISESGMVINDNAKPSPCLGRIIQLRKQALKNIGTKAKVDADVVSELVSHVWKAEVADVEVQNINN